MIAESKTLDVEDDELEGKEIIKEGIHEAVNTKNSEVMKISNVKPLTVKRNRNDTADLLPDEKVGVAFKHILKSGVLQPLTIMYLLRVSKGMNKNVLKYLKQCQHFYFSYFFAVIGNFSNNGQDSFLKFCQHFKSLKSV